MAVTWGGGWGTWESGGDDLRVRPLRVRSALQRGTGFSKLSQKGVSATQLPMASCHLSNGSSHRVDPKACGVLASTAHSCFRAEKPLFPSCSLPSHLTALRFCDCRQVHLPPPPFPRHTCVYTRALLLSAQYYKAGSVVLRFLLKILTPKIKVSEVELWGGDRHGGGALTNEISALRTEATERPLSSSAL